MMTTEQMLINKKNKKEVNMRFNFLKKTSVVTNYEGAKAFVLTPQLELYTAVTTAALTDNFYEKSDTALQI
jgi:hypothetical protein